jgi:subtilisin family serine protease
VRTLLKTLLLLAGLTSFFTLNPLLAQPNKASEGEQFHPTRIIAKLKAGEKAGLQPAALKQQGLKVQRQFSLLPQVVVFDLDDQSQAKAAQALPPQARAKALRERIARLQATGLYEYVEPDYIRTINTEPTDSAFADGTLWGLRNTGQNGGTPGADIGAASAWGITTGSTNVIVAVIDTGIRYTHQELAAQMWRDPATTNFICGTNAIAGNSDPMDDNGHGSHVSGTIGAAANDGNPHVGVAWNVRLMACKFLDSSGSGYVSDEIGCIQFALAKGARIINASYGGLSYSQAEFDAIRSLRDHGVLFVAAAADEGQSIPRFPDSYDLHNIVAVAAVDRSDNLATFSSYGSTVHLGAPGVEIFSCWADSDSDYATKDGTSMAAPHVAGAAALVLSHYPNATLTELRRRILDGVVAIPGLTNKTVTGGRLNVYNSLVATPTGNLEVEVSPRTGSSFTGGKSVTLYAVVSDLLPVTNATVTASIDGFTNLTLLDGGVSPDVIQGDGVYTASFLVPTNLPSLNVNLLVSAPSRSDYTNLLTYPVVLPPPNDDFANRIAITNCQGAVNGSCAGSTIEPGEPIHANAQINESVWYSWIAATNGPVLIEATAGYYTILAVYTGPSISNLSLVADQIGWGNSGVSFDAVAGTEYQIALATFGWDFTLRVVPTTSSLTLADALDCTNISWSGDWFGQTCVTHDGEGAARSRPMWIDWDRDSALNGTVLGPGTLSFWWKVSSYNGSGNDLRFWLNGVLEGDLSGESGWQLMSFFLPSGTNNLQWDYGKWNSYSWGEDAGWVDEVSFLPGGTAPSIVTQPVGLLVNPGDIASFSCVVTGTPPFQYQWRFNDVELGVETNTSLIVSNVHSAKIGGYTVVVTNDYGSVTSTVAVLTMTPELADVLDTPGWEWTCGGAAKWFGQTNVTHDGVNAAQSCPLAGVFGSSWFETMIVGPGTLSFWWKMPVSFVNMYFDVNGQQVATCRPSDWQKKIVFLGQGTNVLRWTFNLWSWGGSVNAGWVDQVSFDRLALSMVPSTPCQLKLESAVGSTNRIEYADDLTTTTVWYPLTNIILQSNPFFLLDTTATNVPQRFYRAVIGPDLIPPVPTGVADITITCDDSYELYLNGALVGTGNNWQQAQSYSSLPLQTGTNVIAVHGVDESGVAALLVDMVLNGQHKGSSSQWKVFLVESNQWNQVAFDDSSWLSATEYGDYGVAPWYYNVANMPTDTTGRWIWSANNDADDAAFFRYTCVVTDHLAGVGIILTNHSFESPSLSAGGSVYYGGMNATQQTQLGWVGGGNGGQGPSLFADGSAWGYATALDGRQGISLQSDASISQVVNFPSASTYTLDWLAASRYGQVNPYVVQVDGVTVSATNSTSNTAWQPVSAVVNIGSAGNHTVSFVGLNPLGGGNSVGIDRVRFSGL